MGDVAGDFTAEGVDEKTFVTKAQWQEVVMQTVQDPEVQSAALAEEGAT